MGTRKRHGMYLSPTDDSQLVQELDRCTVRGRKSDLLRNYALLGYQRALALCANPDLAGDQSSLTQALAELFAPDETPPDFRSAAEFIKARDAGQGRAGQGAASEPVPTAAAAAKPPQPPAPPASEPEPVTAKPKPKPQWSGLSSLVGGSSKDKEQGDS